LDSFRLTARAGCGNRRRCENPLERLLKLSYKVHMTLKAIIHKAKEGGFWAEVPSLPGCLTQGETLDELKANLREAIELWLSVDDKATESHASDKVLELTV
jgi:predicted RNase H-like HicB family nuclease